MDKSQIRKIIRKKRENLDINLVQQTSLNIWNSLYSQEIFKNAKVIMSYMSFKNEIDTSTLNENILNLGKTLVLPQVLDDQKMQAVKYSKNFSLSKFGIREPIGEIYNGDIDLIIIPGIAFDKKGNRIGFGKGYYDRFLKDHSKSIKIAPLYDFQLFDEIPSDKYDILMDILLLENNYLIINNY